MNTSKKTMKPSLNFDPKGGNTILVTAVAETGKDYNVVAEGYSRMEFYSKIRKCPDGYYIESKIITLDKVFGEKKRFTTKKEQYLTVADRHITVLYALSELEHQWWQHLYGGMYGDDKAYNLNKIHNSMMNRLNKKELFWLDDQTIRLDKKEIYLEQKGNITSGTVYREGCLLVFAIDTQAKKKDRKE